MNPYQIVFVKIAIGDRQEISPADPDFIVSFIHRALRMWQNRVWSYRQKLA